MHIASKSDVLLGQGHLSHLHLTTGLEKFALPAVSGLLHLTDQFCQAQHQSEITVFTIT